MPPPMTPAMADHIRQRRPLALLAEVEHPSGTARFWTGIGQLTWNGHVFTGSGVLGTITPIKNTTGLVIQEIQFQIGGVDPAVVATLGDNVRNLGGRAWLAGIGEGNFVIRDPYQIVDSQLDYQSFSAAENGTVSIAVTARTGFYTLDRALDEVWSREDQQLLYPGDSGLDLIPALQNQAIQWSPN